MGGQIPNEIHYRSFKLGNSSVEIKKRSTAARGCKHHLIPCALSIRCNLSLSTKRSESLRLDLMAVVY